MNQRSVWAIVAGAVAAIVVTTLVDVVLHAAGVYPPLKQPINDRLALLATAYRVVISIGGAWLTARLAPANPMKHAMVLGYLGVVFGAHRGGDDVEPGTGTSLVSHCAGGTRHPAVLGGRKAL